MSLRNKNMVYIVEPGYVHGRRILQAQGWELTPQVKLSHCSTSHQLAPAILMGVGWVCQHPWLLGRQTNVREPSQMYTALSREAKVDFFERWMGHLALKGVRGKAFWNTAGASGVASRRRIEGSGCPSPCTVPPILAFFFPHILLPSYFSCSPFSLLFWCFGLPKWCLPFSPIALSSNFPILIH